MGVPNGRRMWLTLLLVAGVPIVVTLWTFLHELSDIGAMDSQNPLEEVAATLLDRVDQRIRNGARMVDLIAGELAESDRSPTEVIGDFSEYVHAGPFLALSVGLQGGEAATYPPTLPDEIGHQWTRSQSHGISPLTVLPGGAQAVTMSSPVGDDSRGAAVVGLFDVETVLGRREVARMRVARNGEAFIADGSGRVILSANRHMLGRSIDEMGLTLTGTDKNQFTGRFTGADGQTYLVGMAGNPGWYKGPHQQWTVGLVAPEQSLLTRNNGMKRYLWAVITAILLITVGMVFVLRRSIRGRKA